MKVSCTRFYMVVLEFHISGRIFILHCVIHLLLFVCISILRPLFCFVSNNIDFFFMMLETLYEITLCETVCISGSHLLLMPLFISSSRFLSLCMVLEQIVSERISFKRLDFYEGLCLEKVFCILMFWDIFSFVCKYRCRRNGTLANRRY